MRKNKIGDIILWIIIVLFFINTFLAYFSYKKAIKEAKPSIYFKETIKGDNKIYNIGLYKVVINETNDTKNVSLKLFFLD